MGHGTDLQPIRRFWVMGLSYKQAAGFGARGCPTTKPQILGHRTAHTTKPLILGHGAALQLLKPRVWGTGLSYNQAAGFRARGCPTTKPEVLEHGPDPQPSRRFWDMGLSYNQAAGFGARGCPTTKPQIFGQFGTWDCTALNQAAGFGAWAVPQPNRRFWGTGLSYNQLN